MVLGLDNHLDSLYEIGLRIDCNLLRRLLMIYWRDRNLSIFSGSLERSHSVRSYGECSDLIMQLSHTLS